MLIAIGSDHAGFEQKQQLIEYLKGKSYSVLDCGCTSAERCDYPDYALRVALAVAKGEVERGILVCGTGLGMAMCADKVAGVRAGTITTPEFAELARKHNDANVCCLSGRFVDIDVNERIVDTFLTTPFEGGRHALRVFKMMQLDSDALPQIAQEAEDGISLGGAAKPLI